MTDLTHRPKRPIFFICIAAAVAGPNQAQATDWNFNIFDDPGSVRLLASPYMGHFRPSPNRKSVV